MLDTPSLERRMTYERVKDELAAVERECDEILGRFEGLGREPTGAEREARRLAYLENRARHREVGNQLRDLSRLL